MIRIGIIGTDSSHAEAFSKIINIDKILKNVKVTHIFGLNESETNRVLSQVSIDNVVSSPDEMIGNVDAVMILFRDGNLHFSYSRPFIKAKIPVWIDKPLTIDYQEAKELILLAKENNTLIFGGSTLKYEETVNKVNKRIAMFEIGKILSATINFPGNLCSQYNGFHFYAPHLCEIALELFGYDPLSVYASKVKDNNVTVILSYSQYNVVLNFVDAAEEKAIYIIGEKSNLLAEISTFGYTEGIKTFISTIKGECQIENPDKLIKSVEIINKIYDSLASSRKQEF